MLAEKKILSTKGNKKREFETLDSKYETFQSFMILKKYRQEEGSIR